MVLMDGVKLNVYKVFVTPNFNDFPLQKLCQIHLLHVLIFDTLSINRVGSVIQ